MTLRDEISVPRALTDQEIDKLVLDWSSLPQSSHQEEFLKLDRKTAEEFFLRMRGSDQAGIFCILPVDDRRSWIRLLAPELILYKI